MLICISECFAKIGVLFLFDAERRGLCGQKYLLWGGALTLFASERCVLCYIERGWNGLCCNMKVRAAGNLRKMEGVSESSGSTIAYNIDCCCKNGLHLLSLPRRAGRFLFGSFVSGGTGAPVVRPSRECAVSSVRPPYPCVACFFCAAAFFCPWLIL